MNEKEVKQGAVYKRRRWLWWSASFLCLGILAAYSWSSARSSALPNSEAPNFTLQDIEGDELSLADFRGKPVVLNFWTTSCQPCVEELPALEKLWQTYNQGDVVVLAINQGESAEKVNSFLAEHPVSFPVLLDKNQKVSKVYRVRGIPQSYFISEEGAVQHKLQGFIQIGDTSAEESLLEYYADKEKLWWRY